LCNISYALHANNKNQSAQSKLKAKSAQSEMKKSKDNGLLHPDVVVVVVGFDPPCFSFKVLRFGLVGLVGTVGRDVSEQGRKLQLYFFRVI